MNLKLSKILRDIKADKNKILYLLVFLSVLSFIAVVVTSRSILNTDGISYISIAEQYANGRWDLAINAWLPPIISWLMAPFIYFGVDGRLAFFIVNICIAAAILILGMMTVHKITKRKFLPAIFFWASATPFLTYSVAKTITPDLLVVLWVMVFLIYVFKTDDLLNKKKPIKKNGLLLGVLGAVGLLVKPFLLYYFIAVILTWLGIRAIVYVKPFKKLFSLKVLKKQLFLPLLIFVTLALSLSPWVIALSAKYDTFTVNSSFSYYTSAFDGKDEENDEIFFDIPPHEEATSYLEDRTVKIYENNKEPSIKGLGYYLNERLIILPIYVGDLMLMSPWVIIVMLCVGAALLFNKISYLRNNKTLIASLFIIIHFLGYWATKIRVSPDAVRGEERYNWPILLIIFLIVAISLPKLIGLIQKENIIRKTILAAVIALIPFTTYIRFFPSYDRLLGVPRVQQYELLADEINENGDIEPGSKIAGNNTRPLLKLAYFLDSQTYGSIGARDFESQEVQNALAQYGIDYFFRFVPLSDIEKPYSILEGQELVKQLVTNQVACHDARDVGTEDCLIQIYRLDN